MVYRVLDKKKKKKVRNKSSPANKGVRASVGKSHDQRETYQKYRLKMKQDD